MKSLTEEKYVFYRLCAGDIQECTKTLALLDESTSDVMRLALIKASIISYARPFSGNESRYRVKGKWRLDGQYVPARYTSEHNKAIEYRDKLIAHSDIPHRNPQLLRAGEHFAIGHDAPLQEEYFEFSKILSAMSAELLKELWSLIIRYEKESL